MDIELNAETVLWFLLLYKVVSKLRAFSLKAYVISIKVVFF